MFILRHLSRTTRRWLTATAGVLLVTAAFIIPTAGVANASAITCVSSPGPGAICTAVSGSGDYVQDINASWDKIIPPYETCNYSAWFYYIPPKGGAYGLKYQEINSCGYGRVWIDDFVYRSFPNHTKLCVKYYDNGGDYIGTDCVGLTK